MTANQYTEICRRLGLETQGQQAAFLGVSIRTAHSYANGSNIPEATAKLLRLIDRLKIKPEDVR